PPGGGAGGGGGPPPAALALVQGFRLARWWDRAVLAEPLLWVLHLGFGWLAVGLGLFAAALLGGWPSPTTAMHGWLAGGAGSLMLGIMTRLALQHTGRPLAAPPASVAAFVLVSVAAAARIAGDAAGAEVAGYSVAAAAWFLAFALFLADHAVPLLRHGRAGPLSG
ncbi:MAG: NnrS family protein, partial [Rhodospirillaceae bacterium]|nr:NnrS family protein [Rhodospirillaceae bacterium]